MIHDCLRVIVTKYGVATTAIVVDAKSGLITVL
jgi:hypothetical protein